MDIHDPLWQKLDALEIGTQSCELTFQERLARDNNWSITFSLQAIAEYKRFIYLIATHKQTLTPSEEVDQVWHLHLLYTRSYWIDMCKNILQFDLHHIPTEGGERQQDYFKNQYQLTLKYYQQTFLQQPPTAQWPSIEKRFSAHLMTHTPKLRTHCNKFLQSKTVLLCLIPFFIVACTQDGAGGSEMWFYIKVAFGIYIVYKIFSWFDGGGSGHGCSAGGGCGSGCGGS